MEHEVLDERPKIFGSNGHLEHGLRVKKEGGLVNATQLRSGKARGDRSSERERLSALDSVLEVHMGVVAADFMERACVHLLGA